MKDNVITDLSRLSWSRSGTGLRNFTAVLKAFYAQTRLKKVQSKYIYFGWFNGGVNADSLYAQIFTGGLEEKTLQLKIKNNKLKEITLRESRETIDDYTTELQDKPEFVLLDNEVYLVTPRAMLDFLLLAKLGGENLSSASKERCLLLSKFLPGTKNVSLVIREDGYFKRIVAVRSENYNYFSAETIDEIVKKVPKIFRCEEISHKWSIDQSLLKMTIYLNDYGKEVRYSFGLLNAVPFVEISESSTGDSSFNVKTGLEVDGARVVVSEQNWQHRESYFEILTDEVFLEIKEGFESKLREYLERLSCLSFDLFKQDKKTNRPINKDLFRYIYDSCEFKTQLGKAMWEDALENTRDEIERLIKSGVTVMAKDVCITLIRNIQSKTLKNERAVGLIPSAIANWCFERSQSDLDFQQRFDPVE